MRTKKQRMIIITEIFDISHGESIELEIIINKNSVIDKLFKTSC